MNYKNNNNNNNNTDQEEEIRSLAQFKASLYYWQHPSIHPLPQSILTASKNTAAADASSSTKQRVQQQQLPTTKATTSLKSTLTKSNLHQRARHA
eukprot:3984711-Ditylum_brightwellii.AAC.1